MERRPIIPKEYKIIFKEPSYATQEIINPDGTCATEECEDYTAPDEFKRACVRPNCSDREIINDNGTCSTTECETS